MLTAALLPGLGAVLVPDWFSYVFTYSGENKALQGFFNAIVLVMESGFAVAGIVAIILNLFLPQELDEELMDDIELQQENLSVLDGHNSPMISHVMSAKSQEAAREKQMNSQSSSDYKNNINISGVSRGSHSD